MMELELGLKVTRTREDVSSSVDFRFSKDPFGPLVLSRETDSMFIIIIHLKGFKKEGIDIEINKEGDRITIRGRKPVEEMVLVRWMAWKKEVEFRAFRKVFLIPDFVDLDKIKARFDYDDATLTITMPKRVRGISGFRIEEEEEEEERVELRDVSEAENRGEVEESEKSDEHSEKYETEIQREEEFGELMEDKERESQVLEEEEKGFTGGLDEEETQAEDDILEKEQQSDEQDKVLEVVEEEKSGQQELADSNTGGEESSLRKLPEIEEQGVMEQQDSQVDTKGDDCFGSRAFEDIEEQEPDEQRDRTSKRREMEKKTSLDDGLRNVQGIEEGERDNKESKIQEMVKGETGDHEKENIGNMERKNRDAKEEVDDKMGKGFKSKTERAQVVGEDDVAETETKAEESESDKLESDELHELIEKKEEKENNAKVGNISEDISLKKLQENEEQHSKGQKRQEKTPAPEENIGNDNIKPVQEIEVPEVDTFGDEGKKGKEKKKIIKMELKNGDAKEEVDSKVGERFRPTISETETKAEEFESDKQKADEVDKIQKLVDKKEEEEAKVGTQSEDISLTKLQEDTEEQQFQGQKKHNRQEEIKELVEEKTPEAEKKVANDTLKPVQERCEGEHKIEKRFQEENKNQPKEYKEKTMETGEKINDGGARKVQELDEAARCEEESKIRELMKSKRNEEERAEEEIAETETKEQESYRPKILREQENIQEIAEEKKVFPKNGQVNEKEEIEQRDSDAKEEVNAEMVQGFTPNIAETETKDKLESDEGGNIHELVEKKEEDEDNAKVRRESEDSTLVKKPQETEEQEEIKELAEEKIPLAETNTADEIPKPVQDIEEQEVDTLETSSEKEIADTETKEQESHRPKILREQENIQEIAEEKNRFSRKIKEEEEIAEKKTEFGEDDMARKVGDVEQRDSDATKGQKEKHKIQELVVEEKVSDGGKGIIAVAETKYENEKSEKVQEIEEQQSHEEEIYRKQFQKPSDHGEVKDEENEKNATEAENSIMDSAREAQNIERRGSDVSEKSGKGDTIQEPQENRETYRNEQEEEKDKCNIPEKIIGRTEQELVNLNSQDNVEDGEKTQELVEEKIKDCKEEESKSKTDDDVARKVQGITEHELDEPQRNHVSKIKELVEEKIARSEIEAECGALRKLHGSDKKELHEPNIHKERDKTRIIGAEEPSGQEKEEEENEKIVASKTITEHDTSTDVQELKEERPEKSGSHEKQYKIQEVVEARHNGRKAEQQDENVIPKEELKTEEDSSKKVQEIEKQEHCGLKRSMVPEKMQETEETDKTGAMKEKEIVERRTKTKDGSFKKVRDDDDPKSSKPFKRQEKDKIQEQVEMGTNYHREKVKKQVGDDEAGLSKPNKRQEEDKIQEPVEMGTSDYREKVKKHDGDEIIRSQEAGRPDLEELERHGKQINISQLVEEEKMENIAEQGEKREGDNSGKFNEFEERKSYDDWTSEKLEKRKGLAKEETTDLKDRHTGGEGHNDHEQEEQEEKVKETEKQESMVQEKMQETEEKYKGRAMEVNEIVERRTKDNDGSLRKVGEGKDPEMGRHKRHGEEEDKIHELVKTEISDGREKVKKKDGDDILRSQETGKLDLGDVEKHSKERKIHQSVEDEKAEGKMEKSSDPGGEMEGEFQKQKSYEGWSQEEREDLVKAEATNPKYKHRGGKREDEEERYEKVSQTKTKVEDEINKQLGKNKELREAAGDGEKEKTHELERHKKLGIIQDFVEDQTRDQEDKKAEEAAAVVANNEKHSSRILHSIKEQEVKEPEEYNEQNKIPETSDPEVKEEDEEIVAEKETKEQEAHVQELEGKLENCKDDDGEGKREEKGQQGRNVETMSRDIERKIQKTRMQETNEKKNQEAQQDKIDSVSKGQEFFKESSKKRAEEQEKIQELQKLKKGEDEEKADVETNINDGNSRNFEMLELQGLDESEENEDQMKIRKPVEEEKTNAPEKEKEGNEKTAEEGMQDETDSRMKNQKIIENRIEEKEIEEMKRKAEDVSSRKVQQSKDELEKHQKPSEISEKHNIQEPVEAKTQEHGDEEMNGGGDHKALIKTKSVASSQSQDVEEKRSDQPKIYAEQEKIQELLLAEEERKEEYDTRERGEKNKEKAKRILQVESKSNDDTLKKNETNEHRSTGLRGQKKKETSDQRKEEKEDEVVGKEETIDEHDSSRKIHESEERKSDKLERHGEEEVSAKLAEEATSDDKEAKEGNRAGVREIENQESSTEVRHRGQDKKHSFVEKDTSGEPKEDKNQETKSRVKTQENEKTELYEQKRNEEQDKRSHEEGGKEDKEIAKAEMPREFKEIEELVGKKTKDQEEKDKNSMITQVLEKTEEHESKLPEGLRKQDKNRELVQQRSADNLKDEESAKTETTRKDDESKKINQIKEPETSEQERRKEQGRIKELVEDKTQYCRENEFEDGSSKKIQEIEKEESTRPGRDEKRDKIQEPVDRETSEDDEEELEVEYEDSEEDWEAEVIQEMDSDEDSDKIRQIKRIRLGFRLVGGSTLFMSLIVIVISFIRSKRQIRCYKY